MAEINISGRKKKVASRKPAAVYSRVSKKKVPARSPTVAKHKVKRGDTLTGIASRYGVSMRDIVKHNRMRDKEVRIGQVIRIPDSD